MSAPVCFESLPLRESLRHGSFARIGVMNTARFGSLEIGRIPRIVGTLSSFDSLTRFTKLAEKPYDVAEVRLDVVGTGNDWLSECKLIEASGTPVIVTLRIVSEGGKSQLGNDQRKAIFKSALPVVSAIDVELKSGLADSLYADAKAQGKAVMVSFHDFDKTPSLDELSEIASQAGKRASVVKISTFINSASDLKTLQSLLQKDWDVPMCVIGMGPLGTSTRVSFPCVGSCLTYGYLDVPAAPGQLPARTLVEELRKTLPTFNEDFSARHQIPESV